VYILQATVKNIVVPHAVEGDLLFTDHSIIFITIKTPLIIPRIHSHSKKLPTTMIMRQIPSRYYPSRPAMQMPMRNKKRKESENVRPFTYYERIYDFFCPVTQRDAPLCPSITKYQSLNEQKAQLKGRDIRSLSNRRSR